LEIDNSIGPVSAIGKLKVVKGLFYTGLLYIILHYIKLLKTALLSQVSITFSQNLFAAWNTRKLQLTYIWLEKC